MQLGPLLKNLEEYLYGDILHRSGDNPPRWNPSGIELHTLDPSDDSWPPKLDADISASSLRGKELIDALMPHTDHEFVHIRYLREIDDRHDHEFLILTAEDFNLCLQLPLELGHGSDEFEDPYGRATVSYGRPFSADPDPRIEYLTVFPANFSYQFTDEYKQQLQQAQKRTHASQSVHSDPSVTEPYVRFKTPGQMRTDLSVNLAEQFREVQQELHSLQAIESPEGKSIDARTTLDLYHDHEQDTVASVVNYGCKVVDYIYDGSVLPSPELDSLLQELDSVIELVEKAYKTP